MNVAELTVKLELDEKDAVKSLNTFKTKMKKISTDMVKIGGVMTAGITTPLVLLGKSMFETASDFEESLNKVNVAFGDSADEVKDFAKTTLRQFGIAEGSALEMASLFGDMSTSMGVSTKVASNMSTELVGLAGDLASFKNVQIEVAQTALTGIFTGETESLKRLGIVMTETNVEQFALANGAKKAWQEMDQAEKVQWRYKYVLDASENSIGDFARTSEGAANQTRTFQENVKELQTEFGENLLPMFTPLIEKANDYIDALKEMDEEQQNNVIQLGLFAVAIGPVLIFLGAVTNAVIVLSGALSSILTNSYFIAGGSVIAFIAILANQIDEMKTVGTEAGNMHNKLADLMQDLVDRGMDWGKGIMGEFWQGFKLGWNDFISWAESTVNPFLDKIGLSQDFSNLKADVTSYYVEKATPLTASTERQLGVAGGVSQTVVINAPTQLNPYEIAKATTKSARALAVGLY